MNTVIQEGKMKHGTINEGEIKMDNPDIYIINIFQKVLKPVM